LFTGWKDTALTEKVRRAEALKRANELEKLGFKFDIAYTSALTRAQTTLNIILKENGQTDLEIIKNKL